MDAEALLAPISEANPAGDDLRALSDDSTFGTVSDARRSVDSTDDPEGVGQVAEWATVVRECDAALRERTKDLELAGWLTQATVRIEGFPGLRDGLTLVHGLIEQFWEQLHPGLEDGEIVEGIRARPLAWLGSSRDFLGTLKSVCLDRDEQPKDDDPAALTWASFEHSQVVDDAKMKADPGRYNELIAAGMIDGAGWRARLAEVPVELLQSQVDLLDECHTRARELEELCEQRFQDEAPNLIPLRDLLSDMRDQLRAQIPDPVDASEAEEPASQGAAAAAATGVIGSRADALQRLSEVADFLRRTEPHSPVSYLVQRAVRWGHMPLEQVLREVVKDEHVLDQIWDTLGLASVTGDGETE